MRYYFLFLILLPIVSWSQTFKYLGPEDGLSNRRVYQIEKDAKGYMWFLTRDGVDRYNGKTFKNYKLKDGFEEIQSLHSLNWLMTDSKGTLYEAGKEGRVFKYDNTYDIFKLVYRIPETQSTDLTNVNFSFIDSRNNLWLCTQKKIYLWNTQTKQGKEIHLQFNPNVKCIVPINDNEYFVGTERRIHYAKLANDTLKSIYASFLGNDDIGYPINALYYDTELKKLAIGTTGKGICFIDPTTDFYSKPTFHLSDMNINTIEPYKDNQVLISTNGSGIHILNLKTGIVEPFIVADYERNNNMNGNAIKDIYVDEEDRIWMANFPIGVTVRDNRFSNYSWHKHAIGNNQSLVNDKVTAIIKDSDGDVWFATSNGISLYKVKAKQWHSFYSSYDNHKNICSQFLSICEVAPGVVWATGYDSDVYSINKNKLTTEIIPLSNIKDLNAKPDSYIRAIFKDSDGHIWLGGHHNFKKINLKDKSISFHNIKQAICIIEKDENHIWVGTMNGLFLLNKESDNPEHIQLPVESNYIYSLYQDNQGQLYIGTGNSGLLIYNPETKQFTHYYTQNSSLISNSICSILSDENNKYVILGTETGVSRFYPKEKKFRNWTKDQGLMTIYSNSSSGIYYGDDIYVLGTIDGAISFQLRDEKPQYYKNKMVLSDFKIFYETVFPGEKNSPLTESIDDTKSLTLNYDQNIFSIDVSSINYAYPSDILYTWKLDGFYDKWRRLSRDNTIRYTNLNPGTYTLHIRAVSNENQQIVLEERSLQINIKKPLWRSIWAYLIYAGIFTLLATVVIRYFYLKRQKKVSNEKIQFFINSAHDLRTPLTLIKAPLEEIREKELMSQNGMSNMNIALRNVNALLRLTTNLINFEKTDVYSSELYISENELNGFITEIFQTFRSYANVKHINFTYSSNFKYLNVWFDRDKMESILKNIISNALKYTPDNGEVQVIATETNENWVVEVKDTGIGIPSSEQKKLFKMHFRGSNAINSKVTGSGIGLMLVWKLVRLHGGKIQFDSTEQKGSEVKITIPKKSKALQKAHIATKTKGSNFIEENEIYEDPNISNYHHIQQAVVQDNQRILIVEDNDELRNYLKQTLAETYIVQTCENGKEAIPIIKEYKPNLIISDIMMPEMRGDELCKIIKSNIETSHIPVILLTALSDEKSVLQGLNIGADEYIGKPFNIGILKATITNILTNRAILQKKYAAIEVHEQTDKNVNLTNDIDWKFISAVKKHVEDNMDNQAFSVDILCNLLNMSRTSFYNKIKALTNQAPADYVRLIRLNKASSLLKEGKHSVVEVAEMTGFNDAKYFREVFKKHFKVSPTKYAKGEVAEEVKSEKEDKEEKI